MAIIRTHLSLRDGVLCGALIVLTVFAALAALGSAPHKPYPARVTISYGSTAIEAAHALAEADIIRSPQVFTALIALSGDARELQAGTYQFNTPQPVHRVATRIMLGTHRTPPVTVVIPEGASAADIARILDNTLREFDAASFEQQAARREGRLFPDTYHFRHGVSVSYVIDTLERNFHTQIEPIRSRISSSPHTLNEVLTMASLVEHEAADQRDRRMIADILWRRLERGMPLQVDATFEYFLGKNTYEVAGNDLTHPSPYNTYANRGLPPGPIGNPGMAAIRATLNPIDSEYLYYLADRSGETYYSTSHEAHVRKKRRYIQ
jgi:UPF0755 protein